MFAELVFVLLTVFLGVFVIDKYSTAILIFVCGILAYVSTSLLLKSFSEFNRGEGTSECSYFSNFLLSSWRLVLHVIQTIRGSYVYQKISAIVSPLGILYRKLLKEKKDEKGTNVSPCKKKHCGLALSVETELKIVIEKILHTYVRSWFCKVSHNTDFIREINNVIEDLFVAVGNSISTMDKKEFLYHMIQVYLRFFRHYVDALHQVKSEKKLGTLEKCISMKKEVAENFKMEHWALENRIKEWHYLHSFTASLVDSYGPVELMSSLLMQNVVTEVLTENLVLPVTDLVIDPDNLNSWFLKFLKGVAKDQNLPLYSFIAERMQNSSYSEAKQCDSTQNSSQSETKQCDNTQNSSQSETKQCDSTQNSSYSETKQCNKEANNVLKPTIVISPQVSDLDEEKASEEIPESTSSGVLLTIGGVPLRRKSTASVTSFENDSVSEASLSLNESRSSFSISENGLGLPNLLTTSPIADGNLNHSANELTTAGLENNFSGASGIKRSRSADYIRQMSQSSVGLLPLNARNHSIRLSGRDNKTFVKFKASCSPSGDVEQAEEAVEAEVPHLFDDVKIIDTEQKVEPGHSPYTLYCIQYWGIFHDISSTTSVPDLVRQKVNVKRRFREFLALQSRLEDIPDLKPCLKGIKGPSKWLATPFSNLDKKNIAERRIFLENYLEELCKQDPIVKSTVLQEFLAYGGDASIAFVKKATDLSVPRIDKMIFRGVKGAIDLFKTALPNTPTPSEAGSSKDGDSEVFESADEDTNSESKFQESLVAFTKNDPEIIEDVENFLNRFGVNSTESLYQTDLSPLDCRVVEDLFSQNQKQVSTAKFGLKGDAEAGDDDNCNGNHLTDTMVDLGAEVLQNIPEAFKTERLVFFIKNLLGPLLDFVTEKIMDIVLQKENCAALLHILHKTVWPEPKPGGGQVGPFLDKSFLLNEAVREYFAEVHWIWTILLLPMRPVLSETFDLLIGSFQNKEMNKCMLFHMCDVVVHSLCSEDIKK